MELDYGVGWLMNHTAECLTVASFPSPVLNAGYRPLRTSLIRISEIGCPYRAMTRNDFLTYLLVFVCSLSMPGKENPLAATFEQVYQRAGRIDVNCLMPRSYFVAISSLISDFVIHAAPVSSAISIYFVLRFSGTRARAATRQT